jgi:hypothetical protein
VEEQIEAAACTIVDVLEDHLGRLPYSVVIRPQANGEVNVQWRRRRRDREPEGTMCVRGQTDDG